MGDKLPVTIGKLGQSVGLGSKGDIARKIINFA